MDSKKKPKVRHRSICSFERGGHHFEIVDGLVYEEEKEEVAPPEEELELVLRQGRRQRKERTK